LGTHGQTRVHTHTYTRIWVEITKQCKSCTYFWGRLRIDQQGRLVDELLVDAVSDTSRRREGEKRALEELPAHLVLGEYIIKAQWNWSKGWGGGGYDIYMTYICMVVFLKF
jgi:hypothetical protein